MRVQLRHAPPLLFVTVLFYYSNYLFLLAIDFRFTQDEYLVREDGGTVMVCLEIASEGFLPRDVVMNLVTVDGLNATGIYMHHVFKDNIKLVCIPSYIN